MSISCRPRSVGWYLIVMVPSLLSVICGRAVLPEGIRTSPRNNNSILNGSDFKRMLCVYDLVDVSVVFVTPVSSPCCGVKGTRKLTGRNRGSTVSRGTTGSLVAYKNRQERNDFYANYCQVKTKHTHHSRRLNSSLLTTTWKGLFGMFCPPKRIVITYFPGSGAV